MSAPVDDAALVIVIIDDSLDDQAHIQAALRKGSSRRYVFHRAETGGEGLRLLQRLDEAGTHPACVVLDFNLPDMDAFEVLATLRGEEDQIATPIVIVTGGERVDANRALIAAGAQDLIGKSWLSAASLTRAVENAMERHALRLRVTRSEAAAREGELRYRELVETMGEGLCVVGLDGRVELTNRAFDQMVGYAPGELIGVHVNQLLLTSDSAEVLARLQERREGRDPPPSDDLHLRTKDGRERAISVAAVNMKDDRGQVRAVLTIITDITEKRKLEQKLQQAQKLESLGVLAGGIAHDFNNLLVGVLGNAGLALLDLPPESPTRRELEDIQTAAIRASELTRQLLAYAGKGRFIIGQIDLGRLVEEMGYLLKASLPKNVVVEYHLAPGLPIIEGDPTQLRQVVMNLITNAADAIGGTRSGLVTVSTSVIHADRAYLEGTFLDDSLVPGDYISLEVSDTGCGMTPETRAKIFDPFFTTKFTGRGLGLAAVLGIMRAHKGAIKVYSEPGRGSTFKILLPALEGARDTVRGASTPALAWRGAGTILVVDDEETIRNVTKRILERAGFQVLLAANGIEALDIFALHEAEIRAVLLDVTMPRMGGEETFRRLRKLAPTVRVLLSSGYSEQEAMSRFAGKGLAGFVEKPFRPQGLLDSLRAVLESDD